MDQYSKVFKEFVERIHKENGWQWVQYLRFTPKSVEITECIHSPLNSRACEALCELAGVCKKLRHSPGHSPAIPALWRRAFHENRVQRGQWSATDEYAATSIQAHSMGLDHFVICPVSLSGRVRAALIISHECPLTEDQVRLLTAYAHEASALERMGRTEHRYREEHRRLLSLVARIADVQDRTAQQIAEHLHGRVQSHLLVAWHQLQQCKSCLMDNPHYAEDLLNQTMALIDTVRDQDIRQLSHQLHPAIIRLAFIPAVEQLAYRYHNVLELKVRIDSNLRQWDPLVDSRFPEKTRLAAYRILEEALNNVVHHAGATAVSLALTVTSKEDLVIEMEDNGRGWDEASDPQLGVLTMMARAEQAGGFLKFESVFPHGTRMMCEIPLSSEATLLKTV